MGLPLEYFTVPEAAQRCRYDVDYFRKLLKKHPIPLRGPGRNRIQREDLEAWMNDPNIFQPVTTNRNRKHRILQLT